MSDPNGIQISCIGQFQCGTRLRLVDASVPARDARPWSTTPHTKSAVIMRYIQFAYRRYDEGI